MPPLSVDARLALAPLDPSARATNLASDPDLALPQLLSDSLGSVVVPRQAAINTSVWSNNGAGHFSVVMDVSGLVLAVHDASDKLHWFCSCDVSFSSLRDTRRQQHAMVTGPWLERWIRQRLGLAPADDLRSWVLGFLKARLTEPINLLVNIADIHQPILSGLASLIVSGYDITRLKLGRIPCRLNVPTGPWQPIPETPWSGPGDLPKCTRDQLGTLQPNQSVYYAERGRLTQGPLMQGVVQGHNQGALVILPRFGGASKTIRLSYEDADVRHHPPESSRTCAPRVTNKRKTSCVRLGTSKRLKTCAPTAGSSLSELFVTVATDILLLLFQRLPQSAGMMSQTCLAWSHAGRLGYPIRTHGTRYSTDPRIPTTPGHSWYMESDPRHRREAMYLAGRIGDLAWIRQLGALGLPSTEPTPWLRPEHIYGLMNAEAMDLEADPLMDTRPLKHHDTGMFDEPGRVHTDTETWVTAAIRGGHFQLVEHAVDQGHRFSRADYSAQVNSPCPKTRDLVRKSQPPNYQVHLGIREMELALEWRDLALLRKWRLGCSQFTLELLIQSLLLGIPEPFDWCVEAEQTTLLAAAAAGAGDLGRLDSAIANGWNLRGSLAAAAESGHTQVVARLAREHFVGSDCERASVLAARHGHLAVLDMLRQHWGADALANSEALEVAAVKGGCPLMLAAVQPGSSVCPKAAIVAAAVGNMDVVREFLLHHDDPGDQVLMSMIEHAAMAGQPDIMRAVCDSAAGTRIYRSAGWLFCSWLTAAANGQLDTMQRMHVWWPLTLKWWATVQLGQKLVRLAARMNDAQMIDWLATLGFVADDLCRSTLHQYGHCKYVLSQNLLHT